MVRQRNHSCAGLLLIIASALSACSGTTLDIGEGKLQAIDASGGDTSTPPPSLEGDWQGTLGDSSILLAPSPVTLHLTASGSGTLLVGSVALPAPTDPNVGYPSSAEADAAEGSSFNPHLYDGVEYPLENVSFDGTNLHFSIDPWRAFYAWCSLQTPLADADGGPSYDCVRFPTGIHVDRSTGEKHCFLKSDGTEIDCLKYYLCAVAQPGGCRCTSSGCGISAPTTQASFELALNSQASELAGVEHGWAPPTSTVAITLVRP